MIRFFLVFLLFYLIFRIIRNVTVFTARSRRVPEDDFKKPEPAAKPNKLIEKDEGEYVDYEDIKNV